MAFTRPELWDEVLSATVLVKGKKVIFISTPKGRNHFHKLCMQPNYDLLRQNTAGTDISIRNFAIGKEDGERMMYYGLNNCGEASMFQGEEQRPEGEMVKVMSAKHLPECAIMKIDTEGAEIEILENLTVQPVVFLIEFHSAWNRRRIDEILYDYTLIDCTMRGYNYGILKYLRGKF